MSPRLRKGRKGGREYEGKDKYYADGIRARRNGSLDRESVKQPDWNHEQGQDNHSDDHGHASGYAASVVVMDVFIIGLVSRFLSSDVQNRVCRYRMKAY